MKDLLPADWTSAEMSSSVQRYAFLDFIETYSAAGYEIQYCSVLTPAGKLLATALAYSRSKNDSGRIAENEKNVRDADH